MTGNSEALQEGSLLVHLLFCSFWEQLPAAGCSCLKTSRQSSRLCLKAGIWRRLHVGASSLPPLSFWTMAAPTNIPCLTPRLSLPCLSLLSAAESLQLLLAATKIFDTFCIKRGNPDRQRQDTGQWLPRFFPTTLAAMSFTSMKGRQICIAFRKICISPYMNRFFLSYFSGDAHFRDRNQISLIPHFATEDMTATCPDGPGCRCDVGQWLAKLIWVCVTGKYLGQMRKKRWRHVNPLVLSPWQHFLPQIAVPAVNAFTNTFLLQSVE